MSDIVYNEIKDRLLRGEFQTSDAIPIDRLASELSVSRHPVMEALKRLSVEGFITILPQIGCHVRRYEPNDISDFFRLFAEGEALIAELAAERASAADIATLKEISARIGMLRELRDDPAIGLEYRRLNRQLHFEMRRAAQSESVAEIVETLGDRSDFFIAASRLQVFVDRLSRAHDEHEAIIAAIEDRNPSRARAIMRAHILHIEERLRAAFS
ncbi:GntR family transcriptional regulator [Pontitalea aquivivens]|uniref:GntR family transcriptional regulator n=1 Tax=Pontitalea aquivivens TaxID=3388663 RepID=UPI003970D675